MTPSRPALLALLGAAVVALGAGGYFALRPAPPHAPAAPVVNVKVTAQRPPVHPLPPRTASAPPPAPHKPTTFEIEQAMSHAQLVKRWDPYILEGARRFDVPAAWIRAVMQAESGGRTMLAEGLPMTSTQGAMGLMQLMPETYDEMRRAYRLGDDPYDPHDNIIAGAAYLRILRAKYGYPQMFAAYNDGPGHLEERMRAGGLLPDETRSYVGFITARLEGRPMNGPGGAPAGRGNLKLTRPDGTPVWIDAGAAVRVRAVFPGEYPPGVQAVITIGSTQQAVREPLAKVRSLIRARGGGT
ncbi:MAG TPA: lytic transglycosylase domain-containing protein [Rhizomicrobium sp.]|nr:lytic transglycosylase domain-containing protein [Rhizomicrobium sp.]